METAQFLNAALLDFFLISTVRQGSVYIGSIDLAALVKHVFRRRQLGKRCRTGCFTTLHRRLSNVLTIAYFDWRSEVDFKGGSDNNRSYSRHKHVWWAAEEIAGTWCEQLSSQASCGCCQRFLKLPGDSSSHLTVRGRCSVFVVGAAIWHHKEEMDSGGMPAYLKAWGALSPAC